jgi:hypothetical protein
MTAVATYWVNVPGKPPVRRAGDDVAQDFARGWVSWETLVCVEGSEQFAAIRDTPDLVRAIYVLCPTGQPSSVPPSVQALPVAAKKKMSLGVKILAGFGGLVIFMVIVSAIGRSTNDGARAVGAVAPKSRETSAGKSYPYVTTEFTFGCATEDAFNEAVGVSIDGGDPRRAGIPGCVAVGRNLRVRMLDVGVFTGKTQVRIVETGQKLWITTEYVQEGRFVKNKKTGRVSLLVQSDADLLVQGSDVEMLPPGLTDWANK